MTSKFVGQVKYLWCVTSLLNKIGYNTGDKWNHFIIKQTSSETFLLSAKAKLKILVRDNVCQSIVVRQVHTVQY